MNNRYRPGSRCVSVLSSEGSVGGGWGLHFVFKQVDTDVVTALRKLCQPRKQYSTEASCHRAILKERQQLKQSSVSNKRRSERSLGTTTYSR